jgi:hypothetical protein
VSGDGFPRINYTIYNDTQRTIRFRLPSGKSYSLQPRETGRYYYTGNPNDMKLYVYETGKQYQLRGGDHKFWWMKEGRVGFDMNYGKS